MNSQSEKIYYYTSNYVLKKWVENQSIWATRSTTSNDAKDTINVNKAFFADKRTVQLQLCT